jgi:hypothetical protein
VARNDGSSPHAASRAVLVYNTYRLGLLGVCLGIGWLAGLRGLLWIVAALAVSGALSWFLLRSQRIAMGMAVEQTVERSRVMTRVAERTAAEDAYAEQIHGQQPAGDQLPT